MSSSSNDSDMFSLSFEHLIQPNSSQQICITKTYYYVCLTLLVIFLLYALFLVAINLIKLIKNCQFAQYYEKSQLKKDRLNIQQQEGQNDQQHVKLNQFLIIPDEIDNQSQKQNYFNQKSKNQETIQNQNQSEKKQEQQKKNHEANKKITEIQNNFMYMASFLILSIAPVSIFNSNIVIGICAIVYIIMYVLFNVAGIANNFLILKMSYIVPVIVGGIMLYVDRQKGIAIKI